ncbi:MAG: hypothetical protein ACLRFO_00140 [Alphaproteobacteria bacterium]
MNFLKRAKIVATPRATTIPENHVSKKKKNTYQIQFSPFAPLGLFEGCKTTPMAVIILNGKHVQTSDWLKFTKFPNPGASDMATKHAVLREIMGKKISTQIIEYLDKYTGKPVVQLYPEMMYIFDGYKQDYMSHLNHASRRDLNKQIALRERLISEFMARQQAQK